MRVILAVMLAVGLSENAAIAQTTYVPSIATMSAADDAALAYQVQQYNAGQPLDANGNPTNQLTAAQYVETQAQNALTAAVQQGYAAEVQAIGQAGLAGNVIALQTLVPALTAITVNPAQPIPAIK